MANSRMYLTCRHCGAQHCLAKGYFGEYSTRGDAQTYVDQLDEFLDKHKMGLCMSDTDKDMIWCNDNARLHFLILEEDETFNPKTNTIENIYVYDWETEQSKTARIQLNDEFSKGPGYEIYEETSET